MKFFLVGCLLIPFLCFADSEALNSEVERLTVLGDSQNQFSRLNEINPPLHLTGGEAEHVAQWLTQLPEVNLSGQGGQFQVFSIRGFSRWRIQTQIEGVPIFSDRRAGTAAEFLPPSFVHQAFVSTGAISTYLGSGAIGGGVDLQLVNSSNTDTRSKISTAYSHQQSLKEIDYHGVKNNHQWAVSSRVAANGSDAEGNLLFDQFEQHSGFWRSQFDQGALKEVWVLFSEGNNIGKSTSDFPNDRITLYPTNDHLLGKLLFDVKGADLSFYWHQSRLDTEIERVGNRQNIIRNDGFDYGFSLTNDYQLGNWHGRWRLIGDGRDGVLATEREVDLQQNVVFDRQILDGSQFDFAIASDIGRDFGPWNWVIGGRLARQQQDNQESQIIDLNGSGFIGARLQWSPQWGISSYVSSAYRTPNLTERFFDGQTPRGQTLGDAALDTENVINSQLSIHYSDDKLQWEATLFSQQIDDYIERIEINDNLLIYQNLNRASIQGASYQITWSEALWLLQLGGQWLDGEDDEGNGIADITPNNHKLRFEINKHNWSAFAQIDYRQSKTDIALSEQPLSSVFVSNIGINMNLKKYLSVQITLSNVTDRQYLTTTDDRSPFAEGRDAKVRLTYQF